MVYLGRNRIGRSLSGKINVSKTKSIRGASDGYTSLKFFNILNNEICKSCSANLLPVIKFKIYDSTYFGTTTGCKKDQNQSKNYQHKFEHRFRKVSKEMDGCLNFQLPSAIVQVWMYSDQKNTLMIYNVQVNSCWDYSENLKTLLFT